MKRKKLLQAPICVPDTENGRAVKYACQLVEIDEKPVLNIDIYIDGTLKARYFADKEKKEYEVFVQGKWRGYCLNNAIRAAEGLDTVGYIYGLNIDDADFEKDDKELIKNYFGGSICWWESCIRYEKNKKKMNRKMERIDALMNEMPAVPEDVEKWLRETIFPENYLFFHKQKNRHTYSCTACGAKSWRKERFTHNAMTKCPKCGAEVLAKGRVQQMKRKEGITILQNFRKGEWVERGFHAECCWKGNQKEINLYEDIRAVIPKGKRYGKVYYGQKYDADEFEQEWWDTNPLNRRFPTGYLYPGTVKDVLKGSRLEHIGLDILADRKKKVNVNHFIIFYDGHPYVEYLVKIGLSKLASDIIEIYRDWSIPKFINRRGRKATEILNIDGNRLNRLKEIDGGIWALKWLKYEAETGKKITTESLEWLDRKKLSIDTAKDLLENLKSVNRMVNYLKKQKRSPSNVIQTWRDYLAMAREEGMDIQDDIVRFPKDLKLRHDQLTEIRNTKKNEKRWRELNQKIALLRETAEKYRYEEKNYTIRPAKRCEELSAEGRALHHCVGASETYMRKMAEGKSWILFLRTREQPDKPYYTLEIDMQKDKVIQWYSEYDRKPDADIIGPIIKHFEKYLDKQKQRIQIAV